MNTPAGDTGIHHISTGAVLQPAAAASEPPGVGASTSTADGTGPAGNPEAATKAQPPRSRWSRVRRALRSVPGVIGIVGGLVGIVGGIVAFVPDGREPNPFDAAIFTEPFTSTASDPATIQRGISALAGP